MSSSRNENEVIDTLLPGKSSKLQVMLDRTPNRHRWVG